MSIFLLQDIKGHVYDFCRDQFGSRFIQQKLETATPDEVTAITIQLQKPGLHASGAQASSACQGSGSVQLKAQ